MLKKIINFYKTSQPSTEKVPAEKADGLYKKLRFQAFIAGTLGYSLYYVCRTGLNVIKGPVVDSGFLNATQLGVLSACLLWAYAIGKFVNGILADYSNIKKFMATGLLVSTVANLLFGLTGLWQTSAAVATSGVVVFLSVVWAINGWCQSMGAAPAVISLSRWFPLKVRGTYYGFFSSSHNIGEGLSFVFCGALVGLAGWQWGFIGAAVAGLIGFFIIVFFLHDTPESKGLDQVEILAGEKTREEIEAEAAAKEANKEDSAAETKRIQKAVFRNPGVWILAIASSLMYISRYAVNGWGTMVLEGKGFTTVQASMIISVNAWCGIFGTVLSGWLSDKVFNGDRKWPALVAGVFNAISIAIFIYGGDSLAINIFAMILRGLSIGVLICFLGGLMAVDLVPRKASGAALGIVGLASYLAAGLQDVITGLLIDTNTTMVANAAGEMEKVIDFGPAGIFWIGAAVLSFLLPILNWGRKQQEI